MSLPKVISMGAGVQTTAILIKYWKDFDLVLFADTGDEMPETYTYIEKYLKPFCKEKGLEWKTVVKGEETLYDMQFRKKIIPMRMRRQCTQDFKILPINKELRRRGATKKTPITMAIGFSTDEYHRYNPNPPKKPKYVEFCYPLLDDHISRKGCKEIITNHGWELPVKSGCYYCPFQTRKRFRELYANHPELFDKAVALEMNERAYPKRLLSAMPLITIKQSQNLDQWSSDEYEPMGTCDEGHCMT